MDVAAARALTQRIYTRLNARRSDVDTMESYYSGAQPLNFATEAWKEANAARYRDFSDNWCGTVVNAEAERLKPIGLKNIEPRFARELWDQLQINEFDAQFSQGIVTALTTGRAYVIVWDDGDGDALVTFEHPANVEIEYDWENPRIRKAALKTWVDERTEYATLYTPELLFKWKRERMSTANERDSQAKQARTGAASDGGWIPRFEDDSEWIIDNPLKVVPVVEISNRPTLKGDPISEIRGVVPMQDAINLLWAYLFLAADYASMDARVMLSTSPPMIPVLDKDGKVIGERPVEMKDLREKRLITLTGDNAKIDSWKAAALDIFTDTIEVAVGHIAAQTRTPPHYLVSNKGLSNLSGDALVAAEIGLVQKANEFITFTDPNLREIVRLVALVKDDTSLVSAARLAGISWKDREKRSESQLSDALLKKSQMGYPFEYLLEEAGKSPDEIRHIMEIRKREMDEALGAGVQAAVQGAMNVGPEPVGVGASAEED
ncbi:MULTISPECIES: phage portal protein [unclassified Microbacterium]|uniref:phage portal protein n=1 Tax=unclassified Microbacterium TaxID=2609290 RepID=UPI00300FE1A5